jgi:hypothetical protein
MEGRRSHPIGQNGAVEHDPVAREDLRLAVERHVLAELGDRHLRQQRLGGDAALDQMRTEPVFHFCSRFSQGNAGLLPASTEISHNRPAAQLSDRILIFA